ncbi:cytochrome P450 [Streptosporangium becharense]|uniref:Cytochrome P450 n=1 Tax=Streptosporangium becharense TaxID=1816182 RepID=A0A7W9ILK2_9ACTN|nr:cytochrome P450 [Streptosporangium becharense]MBB2910236.1 cytochrome P450 [Streptosporangium becharense]MBB5822979.1 cytochrome P450 [Streptosporangium becharense]
MTAYLEEFDVFGHDFAVDPYPTMAALRAHAPVHHDPRTGLWLLSGYTDVKAALLDPDTFRPDNALDVLVDLGTPALRVLARAGFRLPPTLANNGTESHSGLRGLITRMFSTSAVRANRPVIERVVARNLERVETELAATGGHELVGGYARDVPYQVMFEMLDLDGLVDVDTATLARWTQASLELFWGHPRPERQEGLAREAADFYRWLTGLVRRSDREESGFFRALSAHRCPGDRPLDTAEEVALCYFMIIAGQVTTGQMFATMLYRALAEEGRWASFRREPQLIAPWVEEVIRRDPPITTWRRVTGRPVRVGDVELPSGAKVLLMLSGTGSDPDVFPSPEEICPHRVNQRQHLAFGLGRHRCPGAELARTEAEIMLRMTSARLPGLRLAEPGPPPMLSGLLSFRSPARVVVTTT